MKIIGVAGTNGSGKDSLSEYLRDEYGWLFVSASGDLLIPELRKRGEPLERENMAALSAEWNRTVGKGAIVDKAIEKFETESKSHKYNGLVISSIRHPWEVERIHARGGKVIWLDADPELRFGRIYKRGQGHKDNKTYEQFLAEEKAESTHAGDEATLNMSAVKAKADIFITNHSNGMEEFKTAARQALGL